MHTNSLTKSRNCLRSTAAFMVFFSTCSIAYAQNDPNTTSALKDAERFGDIFVHPRDRHYLPGTAPSRAELQEFRTQNLDGRDDVAIWEYRKGNRVITREVWTDDFGNKQSIFKLGRGF